MQEQSSKRTKSKSCCIFWQPLVKKIYAQNADAIFTHKRDVLAALKRLQKAKPDYGFEISYKQESKGYRDCDKSQVICLRKSLGCAVAIEFLVDCDAKYLSIRFSHIDAGNFNVPYERCWCNLDVTLENFVKFVDEFPNYNEQSSRIITEIEKEQKLKEIAQNTIWATISHIMESTKYSWILAEDENTFSLEVSINDEYTVEMDFNIQKLLRTNPGFARHPETNGKLLKRNSVPDNDSVARKILR